MGQYSLDCGGGNTSVSVAILLGYCSYSGALGYILSSISDLLGYCTSIISMTIYTSTIFLLSMTSLVVSMDYGSSGVYDSPMATDYYVKRFGFMFGGGRSGMFGLQALKAMSSPTINSQPATSPYNPSGLYGLKAMHKNVPDSPPPSVSILPTIPNRYPGQVVQEKKMVKLSPIRVTMKQDRKPKMFPRFMAVP